MRVHPTSMLAELFSIRNQTDVMLPSEPITERDTLVTCSRWSNGRSHVDSEYGVWPFGVLDTSFVQQLPRSCNRIENEHL